MKDYKDLGLYFFGLHGVKDVIELFQYGKIWLKDIMEQLILERLIRKIYIINN